MVLQQGRFAANYFEMIEWSENEFVRFTKTRG